jgi:hypothetical protein
MAFLGDDANIEDRGNGNKIFILPAAGLRVNVNKEKALASGIVTEENASRMEDYITWKIPKQTIFKADLMILDMVAHFDWGRAIYFASSADRATFLGLDKYFFAEGLVYKLVPIEVEQGRNPNSLGEVNKTKMYDNLMNVFKWGNMDKEGTLVDYYTRRTLTTNFRIQFSILADAYAELYEKSNQQIEVMKQIQAQQQPGENVIKTPVGDFIPSEIPGKMEQAKALKQMAQEKIAVVLDSALAAMPHSNAPFDKVIPNYISAYYIAGEEKKAQELSNQIMALYKEEMDYYLSVEPEFSASMIDDMYSTYRSIFSVYQSSAIYGTDKAHQDQVSDEFYAITDQVQRGLESIRRYSPSAENRIAGTFDTFFRTINGQ